MSLDPHVTPSLTERDAIAERRRRTLEYGYRVCGLWDGSALDGRPRVCVMPRGHVTSPHRDADGVNFANSSMRWPMPADDA